MTKFIEVRVCSGSVLANVSYIQHVARDSIRLISGDRIVLKSEEEYERIKKQLSILPERITMDVNLNETPVIDAGSVWGYEQGMYDE